MKRTSKKLNQSSSGLSERLRNAVENISVDVFGYEKKVAANVLSYLRQVARDEGVRYDVLHVRIIRQPARLRAFLHLRDKQLREIPLRELIAFFAGEIIATLPGVEAKITAKVSGFLQELSEKSRIEPDKLKVCISAEGEKIIVRAHYNHLLIEDIPLRDLVKYFRG